MSNELIPLNLTVEDVLLKGKVDDLTTFAKTELKSMYFDENTATGLAAIRSTAFKIRQTKQIIIKGAKELTEKWRTQTKDVNEKRDFLVKFFEDLEDEVRAPLTKIEEAEKRKEENLVKIANAIKFDMVQFRNSVLSEVIIQRIKEISELNAEDNIAVIEAKNNVIKELEIMLDNSKKEESEKAELARLKAEEDKRKKEQQEIELKAQRAAEEKALRERLEKEAHEKAQREAQAEIERQKKLTEQKIEEVKKAERIRIEIQLSEERQLKLNKEARMQLFSNIVNELQSYSIIYDTASKIANDVIDGKTNFIAVKKG